MVDRPLLRRMSRRAPRRDRGLVEGVDESTAARYEGDVGAGRDGITGDDPEVRLAIGPP